MAEELLAQIRQHVHHPATVRDLMRMLRVPRDERASFRRRLKALVAAGELLQVRGNRYGLPEKMDLVVGRLTTNPGGFGFVIPEQPDPDAERPDIYIAAANLSEAMHGDRVVVRIERRTERGAEGRIIRILERSQASIVGRYEVDDAGLGYVVPFDKRVLTDVQVPTGSLRRPNRARWCVVEITRWPTATRGPVGRVVEVLGRIDEPGVDTQIIIRKFGIPDTHSDEAIAEATRLGTVVKERDIKGRTDFRGVTTVTIDGEHARDFDDAITIEKLPNGHFWLGVHIADVSHYVTEGSVARRGCVRSRHVGLLHGARRAHVPGRARDRAVQPESQRRSAGAVVPDGSGSAGCTSCGTRCTTVSSTAMRG